MTLYHPGTKIVMSQDNAFTAHLERQPPGETPQERKTRLNREGTRRRVALKRAAERVNRELAADPSPQLSTAKTARIRGRL